MKHNSNILHVIYDNVEYIYHNKMGYIYLNVCL